MLPIPTSTFRQRRPARRGVLARAAIAAWLLVQLVVVGGVPVLDATVGHVDEVVAHWEDADDTSCPPLHDTSQCQLCQQLTVAGRHTSPERLLPLAGRAAAGPAAAVQGRAPRAVAVGVHNTRAPPTA